MSKKRNSVQVMTVHPVREEVFERVARDFASKSGIELKLRELQVFIQAEGREELLCVIDDPNHPWRITWNAMREKFPELKRTII